MPLNRNSCRKSRTSEISDLALITFAKEQLCQERCEIIEANMTE